MEKTDKRPFDGIVRRSNFRLIKCISNVNQPMYNYGLPAKFYEKYRKLEI